MQNIDRRNNFYNINSLYNKNIIHSENFQNNHNTPYPQKKYYDENTSINSQNYLNLNYNDFKINNNLIQKNNYSNYSKTIRNFYSPSPSTNLNSNIISISKSSLFNSKVNTNKKTLILQKTVDYFSMGT